MVAKKIKVEDLGIVLKNDLKLINSDYESCSMSLLHYTSCTLNDALLTFKEAGRMDKIQLLQELIQNFMDKLLIEKHVLNMSVLHKECKLDPSLAPKLESAFGKKLFQSPPPPKSDGGLKFNRG